MGSHINHLRDEDLEQMLELAPVGAIRISRDNRCLYANKAWEEISGIPRKKSAGKGWLQVLTKDDIDNMNDVLDKAVRAKEETASFYLNLHHPEGETRPCKINCRLVFDPQGNYQYFIGFTEGLTLEKQAMQQLEEQAQDFQTLITSLEDIIIEIGLDKIFKNVWTRDDSLLFLPRAQFLGKTVEEVFGPHAPVFLQPIDEVIATGQNMEFVYKDVYNSTDKWYKAKIGKVNKSRQSQTLVVIVQDYTQTMQYENALKEVSQKLEQGKRLLDVSQELSLTSGWEYDFKSGKITLTRQAYLIYDTDDDFIPTRDNMREFYDESSWTTLKHSLAGAIRDRTPFDIELEVTTAKQVKKWVRVIGSEAQNRNGTLVCTGAFMDISRIKEIEAELIKAKNIAESAAREKTEFLSIMSHEIRTPLNNIIGLLNILKIDHPPEQETYINNLIFSSDHLLQLINDILSLHKIEGSRYKEPLTQIDPAQFIRDIREQFTPFAKEKAITLTCRPDHHLPPLILANATRLGQILNNLISNAIKFTNEGEVIITASLKSLQHGEALIHFSVKDTGIGIPAGSHAAVFESFKQLTQQGAGKYPSTGLGLTITKKLIESQGSRIYLKSVPGKGTEFYFDLKFRLPVQKNTATGKPPRSNLTEDQQKERLQHMRLLLIEDNPVNILVAQKHLKHAGIEPDCAASGKEALSLLKSNDYHAVLLDLHMPDMDGYTIAKAIREQSQSVKIIIFTADIMAEPEEKFAALGITDILHKPFLPGELLNILLKVSGEGKSASQP